MRWSFFVKQRLTLNLVIVIDFLQENYVNSNEIDDDDWNIAKIQFIHLYLIFLRDNWTMWCFVLASMMMMWQMIINTNILLRGDIEPERERTRITSSSLSPVRSSDESDILEKESKLPLRSAEVRPRFDACNSVGDALRLAPAGTLALPEISNNNHPNLLEFSYSSHSITFRICFFDKFHNYNAHTYFWRSIHWSRFYQSHL